MNILRIDNATTCYQSARRSKAPVQCTKNTTINIHIHNDDYHTCIAKISTTTLDKTTKTKRWMYVSTRLLVTLPY